jgi:hypothetical protein
MLVDPNATRGKHLESAELMAVAIGAVGHHVTPQLGQPRLLGQPVAEPRHQDDLACADTVAEVEPRRQPSPCASIAVTLALRTATVS